MGLTHTSSSSSLIPDVVGLFATPKYGLASWRPLLPLLWWSAATGLSVRVGDSYVGRGSVVTDMFFWFLRDCERLLSDWALSDLRGVSDFSSMIIDCFASSSMSVDAIIFRCDFKDAKCGFYSPCFFLATDFLAGGSKSVP